MHVSAAQLSFQPTLPCSQSQGIAFPTARPAVFWEHGAVGQSQGQQGWPAIHRGVGFY